MKMPDPPLFSLVDSAYRFVMDNMPQVIQDRPMPAALALGYVGSRLVGYGFQKASKTIGNRLVNDFDHDFFPAIEEVIRGALFIAPVAYGIFFNDDAMKIVQNHPVYTAGMAGAYMGMLQQLSNDLRRREVDAGNALLARLAG